MVEVVYGGGFSLLYTGGVFQSVFGLTYLLGLVYWSSKLVAC